MALRRAAQKVEAMTGKLLGLIMALCGDDKSCLSQSMVHEPAPVTVKDAAVLVEAVKMRIYMLKDSGNNKQVAQPLFECMIRRKEVSPYPDQGKCWTEAWDAQKEESKK